MFELLKTKTYLKAEKAYASVIGKRLAQMEEALVKDPLTENASIKRLTNHIPAFRYRIGGYRVFYDVLASTVLLQDIRTRGESYKK